jgi:hypothetical protein
MVDPDATGSSEGKSKSRWEGIRSRLINSGPLEKAEPPLLASNLGRMADRLDHSRPKSAARRMFQEAFGEHWEDLWRKRKRLVRLPGEALPPFERDGEYEARGAKYVRLAEAFAKLRGGGADDGDAAIRFLTRGTSFNPVRDSSPHDQEGVDLAIEELISRLSDPAIHSKIATCFANSRYLPVENNAGIVSISPYSKNISGGEIISNLSPRVKIGKLYIPIDSPCFSIGRAEDIVHSLEPSHIEDSIDKHLDKLTKNGLSQGAISSIILQYALEPYANKLIAQKLSEMNAPSDLFSQWANISDWSYKIDPRYNHIIRRYIVYAEYSVSIFMRYIEDDGSVEPALLVSHDDYTSFDNFVFRCDDNFIDFTNNRALVDGFEDDEYNYRLLSMNGEAIVVWDFERLSDLREKTWPDIDGVYKLDDPEISDMMMNGSDGECFFEPTVWDDRSLFATAPQASMVATILRNLAYAHANGADGLDDLIFADAEKRLNPVLKFYEDQRAAFDEAMGQRY